MMRVSCGPAFLTTISWLPRNPTPAQQVLIEQIKDGLASRMILVGIEGADATTRAGISKAIAARLRNDPAFVSVNNGEPVSVERDRAFLFAHADEPGPLLSQVARPLLALQAEQPWQQPALRSPLPLGLPQLAAEQRRWASGLGSYRTQKGHRSSAQQEM